MIILNDLHIGAVRGAGTTPVSALALRQHLLAEFVRILDSINEDLIILGDMFDSYNIPVSDLIASYAALVNWLDKGHRLVLVTGNHDLSTDSSKLSSFEGLACMLEIHTKGKNYQFVKEPVQIDNMYIIPHLRNQDLLDMALSKVPKTDYLLVHCNYHNFFTRESDNSLNISEEQAIAAPVKQIIFAHEHNARTALKDKVFICGNQIPTSIADCLSKEDKYMTRISDSGVERVVVWESKLNYAELDWRELSDCEAPFIRIVGACVPEEAADMANAIAGYRKRSKAFVVGNAVKVQSMESAQELATLEDIEKFSILDILKEYLTETEYEKIESLNV